MVLLTLALVTLCGSATAAIPWPTGWGCSACIGACEGVFLACLDKADADKDKCDSDASRLPPEQQDQAYAACYQVYRGANYTCLAVNGACVVACLNSAACP
jgi:hypothetical protein